MLNPHEVILRASFRKELALCVLFPNIYGAVNALHAPFYATAGAMSLGGNVTGHAPSGVSSGGDGSENVVISGANSSSIYKGEFNTVQPPALRALALIRAY